MAGRGMLPKFRPTQAGQPVLARPSIRPMKPLPPPPPPSPPRRRPSGISKKKPDPVEALPKLYPDEEDLAARRDAETALASYAEPETNDALTRARVELPSEDADEETRALIVPDDLPERGRRDTPVAQIDVPFDALPSLEVAPPFDRYEAEFAERDPAKQLAAARASVRARAATVVAPSDEVTACREPSYQEPSYSDGAITHAVEREASGARERPEHDARAPEPAAFGYSAPLPAYDESPLPILREDLAGAFPAPPVARPERLPREMERFPVGVQPVRPITPTPSPPPVAMAMTQRPMPAPPFVATTPFAKPPSPRVATPGPYPQPAYAPRAPYPPPHAQLPPPHVVAAASSARAPFEAPPRAAIGPQLRPRGSSARFLWFVVGAVFGIGAFFGASHFLLRSRAPEAIVFPPAAPLPSATQAPPPAATQPPAAPPAAPVTPVSTVVAAPAAPPPAAAQPPSKPSSTAKAPAPHARGNALARRPSSPPSSAPKQMYTGSAPINDDGSTAPGAGSGGAGGGSAAHGGTDMTNAGDLLGAALQP